VSCRSGGGRGPRSRCSIERWPRPLRRPGILQAFPKFRLFSASFSKQSFGRCLGFQGVAIEANRKSHFPNFLSSPPARRARRAPPNRYLIFRFSERKIHTADFGDCGPEALLAAVLPQANRANPAQELPPPHRTIRSARRRHRISLPRLKRSFQALSMRFAPTPRFWGIACGWRH